MKTSASDTFRTLGLFILLIAIVISASLVSSSLWGGKPEKLDKDIKIVFAEEMTVSQFGKLNSLEGPLLKQVFALKSKNDKLKSVESFGLTREQITSKVNGALAIRAEHGSKNWKKILVKFILWLVFLTIIFKLLNKGRITHKNRRWLLAGSVVVFGVILGSDPSPMGTVKDAIVLFGSKGVIFPPRLIAFAVFMSMVIIANKFICSWGCQLGTLQDLIFRLNRNRTDEKARLKQFKVPFAISNAVRIFTFVLLTIAAFAWATDIIEYIDPFKIFKPSAILPAAGIFIAFVLVMSLFIYRPWCHFFCPFGLTGWLAEKISFYRIRVNHQTCISCGKCSKACPSTVMGCILKHDRTIPDCFSCGNCIEVCPTKSITFAKKNKASKEP